MDSQMGNESETEARFQGVQKRWDEVLYWGLLLLPHLPSSHILSPLNVGICMSSGN